MKKSNVDIYGDKYALQKLRKEVKRVNHVLYSQRQARLDIEYLAEGFDTLTHVRFEELNNDIFKNTAGPVGKIIDDADVGKSEVDKIVLVEGFARYDKY